MAWIAQPDIRSRVVVEIPDDDYERYRTLSMEVRQRTVDYLPYDILIAMEMGIRYPSIDKPFNAQIKSFHPPLLGMFGTRMGRAVSAAAIDLIEAIDPDIHQYIPLELTMPDGSPTDEPYKLINVCQRADAVAFEESKNVSIQRRTGDEQSGWYWYRTKFPKYKENPFSGLLVSGSAVRDLSIWYDYRLNQVFISDELFNNLVHAKVVRLELDDGPYNFWHIEEI